jgi:hypothetical protein
MNPLLIASLIAGFLGFSGAWTLQNYRMDSYKLEITNERIALQRAARAQSERQITQFNVAQTKANDRVAVTAAVAADNRTELERLRSANEAAMRTASTGLETCVAHATTQGKLLNQCAERYSGLATLADGHASDIQTLMDSTPP